MSGFFDGFFFMMKGARLLWADSRLRALAVVPFFASITVGSLLTIFGLYGLTYAISFISVELIAMFALDPSGFASLVMTIALWPLGLAILGVAIYVAVRLVAAPFYSYLAEQTLVKLGVRSETPFRFADWIRLTGRMFIVSLGRAIIVALAGMLLFILSFIPVVNFAAVIGFMLIFAVDISDYGFEAMEWSLRKRFAYVKANFGVYLGMACGLAVTTLVPGLNLILLPAAVVGACATMKRVRAEELM